MAISLSQSASLGFKDFWTRKMRSAVTILGIILGTMSIMVVSSLTRGMNETTKEWILARGGMDKIRVRGNWEYREQATQPTVFTYEEFHKIREMVTDAYAFNPTLRGWGELHYKSNGYGTSFHGVLPAFAIANDWTVSHGRFITENDVENRNNVIVIGTNVAETLFGNSNPVGKSLKANINGKQIWLTVIGLMRYRYMPAYGQVGRDNALDYMNYRCYMPLTTLGDKVTGESTFWGFDLKAKSLDKVEPIKNQLEAIFANIRNREPVFNVETSLEEVQRHGGDSAIFTVVFTFIGGISLLVGGIVIMNIMLASVQERTREIGVRLAVGARRFDIFLQFLIQTVIITFIGGAIGVFIGFSILDMVSKFLNQNTVAGADMALMGLLVSVVVGMIFGIFPALRAANLDPVKALRYE